MAAAAWRVERRLGTGSSAAVEARFLGGILRSNGGLVIRAKALHQMGFFGIALRRWDIDERIRVR